MKQLKYSVTIANDAVGNSPILLQGPWEEQVRIAHEIGYDGVELQLRNPENFSAKEFAKLCNIYEMSVSAIATGLEYTLNKLSLISDDPNNRQQMIGSLKRHIDLAAELNTLVIIGCVRGNIPVKTDKHVYWERFDAAMNDLADYAAKSNVTIVLEAINSYVNNYLNSIPDTIAYIDRLGKKNVKLHIDTHHMNLEDEDLMTSLYLSEPYLGYVHFSGINRLYPKPGRLPYPEIQNELRRMSYDGFISLECIPVPDGYTASKRGLEYLKNS